MTDVWLDLLEGSDGGTGTYPECMNWFLDSVLCGRIHCLALIQWGGSLVLPSLGIPDSVESLKEALPPLEEWMGIGLWKGGGRSNGRELKLGLLCKI